MAKFKVDAYVNICKMFLIGLQVCTYKLLIALHVYCRAAHQLWSDTLSEYQCVDISQWMGDLAKALRTGI